MACVKIKTRVAVSTLGDAAQPASLHIIFCRIGDEKFKKFVPSEHKGQIVHQALAKKFELCRGWRGRFVLHGTYQDTAGHTAIF